MLVSITHTSITMKAMIPGRKVKRLSRFSLNKAREASATEGARERDRVALHPAHAHASGVVAGDPGRIREDDGRGVGVGPSTMT